MPAFKYGLRQRVIVPGKKIEGFVAARAESVDRENGYELRWFGSAGAKCEQWFDEAQLAAAQPVPESQDTITGLQVELKATRARLATLEAARAKTAAAKPKSAKRKR